MSADRMLCLVCFFFFQAEDGIRDLVRSRGLGDVYKRQQVAVPSAVAVRRVAAAPAAAYGTGGVGRQAAAARSGVVGLSLIHI